MADPVNKNPGSSDDDATIFVDRSADELRPGDMLRERFVIERLLGEGGMGKVFLAVDRQAEQSNPHVAIKMLSGSFKDHPKAFKALQREATQSRQLNHPNIVNVYDFDSDGDHVFMVMEYMRGQSLDTFIERNPDGNRLADVWPIVEACCDGLVYLHSRQIIHADFKPGNVFVTEDGEVKVLDLGIARTVDETQLAEGTTRFDPDALGALTPQYASCEMFEGLPPNAQDDLYALGCVVYELLTGNHPFGRKTALEARANKIVPKRPKGLKPRQWRTLSASLAINRVGRPASVAAFLAEMAPKKGGTPLPWIIMTAALVVSIGVVILLTRTSAEQEFVNSVLTKYSGNPDQPVTQERVDGWLSQGSQMVAFGRGALEQNQTDRAIVLLRTGSSSAYHIYFLVLFRSNDPAAKLQAAQGHLTISHAFRDALLTPPLSDAPPEAQLKIACNGLAVNMFEPDLRAVARSFNDVLPGGIKRFEPCDELINSGALVFE